MIDQLAGIVGVTLLGTILIAAWIALPMLVSAVIRVVSYNLQHVLWYFGWRDKASPWKAHDRGF